MKHLDVNLTKHVQKLYAENYKILMKEIKDYLNKWRKNIMLCIRRQHSKHVDSSQID